MNKIDQILDSLYSRVIGPDEAKEELLPLINQLQEALNNLVLDNLNKWEENAKDGYMKTPLCVLKYISELEKTVKNNVVSNDRTFSYEEVYKIASDVMNLGLSLRQDQLNGLTDKSGNEVLDEYMNKFKS